MKGDTIMVLSPTTNAIPLTTPTGQSWDPGAMRAHAHTHMQMRTCARGVRAWSTAHC